MSYLHHYSVTRLGPDPVDRWFHTFEEANASFSELAGSAGSDGLSLAEESDWRKHYRDGSGQEIVLALDDRGLAPCGERCAGG